MTLNTIPHTSSNTRCHHISLRHFVYNTNKPKLHESCSTKCKPYSMLQIKTFFVVLLKKSFVIHLCCLKNIVLEKLTISRDAIHFLTLHSNTLTYFTRTKYIHLYLNLLITAIFYFLTRKYLFKLSSRMRKKTLIFQQTFHSILTNKNVFMYLLIGVFLFNHLQLCSHTHTHTHTHTHIYIYIYIYIYI